MVRFNLQLFAKSVEEVAKEVIKGNWGNGETRKTKLTNAGYNYSEVQSTVNEMLGVGNKKTTTTTTTTNTKNTQNKKTNVELAGVDSSLVDTIGSEFQGSDELLKQGQDKDDAKQAYLDFAGNTDIISDDVMAGLTTPYTKSDAVLQAEQLLQSKIEQGYAGTHKEALNKLLNEIMNREDFEYDVDKDQMFQQALASAMGSGRTAMQDTMGQAAALTGGYGSTYATTAGNQAYNAFIQDAYDNLPEYYNMALAAYEAEGQQMLQQYSVLDAADTKEYSQWYDGINLQYQTTRDMVADEYNQWSANQTMYANTANVQLQENAQIGSNLYNAYSVTSNEYENTYAKEWQSWTQSVDTALGLAGIQNSDYWSGKNYELQGEQLQLQKDQFDYQKDQDSITQSNWEKQYNLELAASGATVDENGNISFDNKYANYINPDDIEVDQYGNITSVKGYNLASSNGGSTSEAKRATNASVSKFRTIKGDNFTVTVNGKNYAVENKGKVDDSSIVNKLNTVTASNDQIINYSGDLYVKRADGYYKIGAKNGFLGIGETNGYSNLLGVIK